MIYKIIGIVGVCLCGGMAAVFLRSAAKQRLTEAEAAIELLRFIRSQIECFAKPLPRLLAEVPCELYLKCGFERASPPRDMNEFFCECDISDDGVREILSCVCGELGRGYLGEQLRTCDYYISLLEDRRNALATSLPARQRALGAVCIAAALGTVIILF